MLNIVHLDEDTFILLEYYADQHKEKISQRTDNESESNVEDDAVSILSEEIRYMSIDSHSQCKEV